MHVVAGKGHETHLSLGTLTWGPRKVRERFLTSDCFPRRLVLSLSYFSRNPVSPSPLPFGEPWNSLLLLLSHFSCVWLCATTQTGAHQAPPSLGFSRQEHWSGLPFPSPMHESEKWKWSRSVVSDPQWPHELQPSRLLRPWDFQSKSIGVGCHCLLRKTPYSFQ